MNFFQKWNTLLNFEVDLCQWPLIFCIIQNIPDIDIVVKNVLLNKLNKQASKQIKYKFGK